MRRELHPEPAPGYAIRRSAARLQVASVRRTTIYLPTVPPPYRVRVRDAGRPRKGSRWAALIREIVGQPGWSVQRLARESEIHRSTIFRWINGEIRTVSIESVQLIADAAGVDFGVALRAASDLIAGSPARNLDELSEEIKRVVDQSGLPEEDRFAIAQMLLDEFDRDELNRQRQRLDRARATVETWKRARGA